MTMICNFWVDSRREIIVNMRHDIVFVFCIIYTWFRLVIFPEIWQLFFNRINPLELYACDISEIKNKKDTFVQNILYQLGKKGITSGIDVVISNEKARKPEKIVNTEHIITNSGEEVEFRKITPSSTPFVASCAGIVISSIIVRKIMENN